jgi:hypothetical protein
MVPALYRRDALTDSLDDAGALVAEDRGRVPGGVGPGGCVHVCVANAARYEAHKDLSRARIGEIELLDDEWLAKPLKHGGAYLHGGSPFQRFDGLA